MTAFRIYQICLACFCTVCGFTLMCFLLSLNTVWPLQGACLQFHHMYLSCLHFMLKTIYSESGIFKECTEKSKLSPPLKSSGIETDYIFGLRWDVVIHNVKPFSKTWVYFVLEFIDIVLKRTEKQRIELFTEIFVSYSSLVWNTI
jgi:hypothetical protein